MLGHLLSGRAGIRRRSWCNPRPDPARRTAVSGRSSTALCRPLSSQGGPACTSPPIRLSRAAVGLRVCRSWASSRPQSWILDSPCVEATLGRSSRVAGRCRSVRGRACNPLPTSRQAHRRHGEEKRLPTGVRERWARIWPSLLAAATLSAVGGPAAVVSYRHARDVIAQRRVPVMAPWLALTTDGMLLAALVVIWVRRHCGEHVKPGPGRPSGPGPAANLAAARTSRSPAARGRVVHRRRCNGPASWPTIASESPDPDGVRSSCATLGNLECVR
jgi:hypothetical protein